MIRRAGHARRIKLRPRVTGVRATRCRRLLGTDGHDDLENRAVAIRFGKP